MGYIYSIDPKAMFEDRFGQFVTLGIPRADVEEMQRAINDMWIDAHGGWVYEWSRLARRYLESGNSYLASLAFGCAKFPCLANEARKSALANQVDSFVAAAPGFPVRFERRLVQVPYLNGKATVPVHLYSATGHYDKAPVLLLSGGVDTWKMDIHGICVAFTQQIGATVLAFDQPGTGETPVALTLEADEVVVGLVKEARQIGNGKVAHMGISFGANYSAMTGLLGAVDASIVLGGPVDKAFAKDALVKLPYGMAGIIGNDMGFDRQPTPDEFVSAAVKLSRHALLERQDNAPMLVINGEDDYFVPKEDTLIFGKRPQTDVHLIAGTGHCAFSKLGEVMPLMFRWLPRYIGTNL